MVGGEGNTVLQDTPPWRRPRRPRRTTSRRACSPIIDHGRPAAKVHRMHSLRHDHGHENRSVPHMPKCSCVSTRSGTDHLPPSASRPVVVRRSVTSISARYSVIDAPPNGIDAALGHRPAPPTEQGRRARRPAPCRKWSFRISFMMRVATSAVWVQPPALVARCEATSQE